MLLYGVHAVDRKFSSLALNKVMDFFEIGLVVDLIPRVAGLSLLFLLFFKLYTECEFNNSFSASH